MFSINKKSKNVSIFFICSVPNKNEVNERKQEEKNQGICFFCLQTRNVFVFTMFKFDIFVQFSSFAIDFDDL